MLFHHYLFLTYNFYKPDKNTLTLFPCGTKIYLTTKYKLVQTFLMTISPYFIIIEYFNQVFLVFVPSSYRDHA